MCANIVGFGETARSPCDKYHNLMTWLNYGCTVITRYTSKHNFSDQFSFEMISVRVNKMRPFSIRFSKLYMNAKYKSPLM